MTTLEQLLRMQVTGQDKDGNDVLFSPDFRVAVQRIDDDGVHVIIHANGYDSDTMDILVMCDDVFIKR